MSFTSEFNDSPLGASRGLREASFFVPSARFCHTAALHGSDMLVLGGYNGKSRLSEFCRFRIRVERRKAVAAGSLVADVAGLLRSGFLSDVRFEVGGRAFAAHRAVVSRCPYFRAMFSHNTRETKQESVSIGNVVSKTALFADMGKKNMDLVFEILRKR